MSFLRIRQEYIHVNVNIEYNMTFFVKENTFLIQPLLFVTWELS